MAHRAPRLPVRPRRPAARRASPCRERSASSTSTRSRRRCGSRRSPWCRGPGTTRGTSERRTSSAGSPAALASPCSADVGEHGFTMADYANGRLFAQVIPMLHDDSVWQHPLIASAFGVELRDRLRAAAGEVPAYVEEVLALPHAPAHGDACPNNLLTTGDDSFTLIDFGFWMPMPVGADLSQLLIGDVQIGKQRAGDLAARDDAHVAAYVKGLRDEGCAHPRARGPAGARAPHADDERPLGPPRRAPRPPPPRPGGPGRRPRRHRPLLPRPGATCAYEARPTSTRLRLGQVSSRPG